ncbi:MAG: adenylate/guanylate cyclase domain-containing protein [Cytophagales bacterium]
MKRLKTFIYLFLLLFSAIINAQTLEISKNIDLESLKPYLKICADSLSNMNVKDLAKDSVLAQFKPFNKNLIDKAVSTHWMSIQIANASNTAKTKYIGLGDETEYITIYVYSKDTLINTINAGGNIPINKREIKIGRDNIIKIEVPALKTYRYFIRIENKNAFSKQFMQFMSEYFIVYSTAFFDENLTRGRVLNSFYYGAIFIMFFYNLFLAISLKSKEYSAYVVSVAAFFLFNIFSDGYPSETILSNFAYHDRMIRILIAPATFMAYIYFSRIYLKTKMYAPKTDKLYFVFFSLLIGCYLPLAIGYWWLGRNAMTYVLIAFISYYAIISFVCYKNGNKIAIYYIIGNSLLLFSGLIYSLYLLALVPHNGYTRIIEYMPQVGSIFEFAIFSLGLSYRIKIAETEKANAQMKTIELLTKNGQMIAEQNELLETNVKLRTEELRTANLELNTTNTALEKVLIEVKNEREIADQLLLNILPESIANELKETGFSEPKQYESATIVFADLVNFTSHATLLSPIELTKKLDALFYKFDNICADNKLEKIKTIGDCYMAAGGLPIINHTNAFDAVKAGLEMIQIAKDAGWPLRVGIHTGPVVAGVIGINKFAYDVWGDTVNIASRLESTSDQNKVNISKETYFLVQKSFECTYRGKIDAKNKGEIDMYFANCIL